MAGDDVNKRILEVLERLDKRDDDYVNRLGRIEGHLATLNGTVTGLQQRSESHSGKLSDHDGRLAEYMARLAVVERVTEVQDEHLSAGIRDARSGAWEARVEAGDVRKDTIKTAALTAAFIVGILLILSGVAAVVLVAALG